MSSPSYPDDVSGPAICYMEGCTGKGPCPNCGETNYHLMGYYGAVARWAKAWGVTEEEAEKRIGRSQMRRAGCPDHGPYKGNHCTVFVTDELNYENIGVCGYGAE